MRSAIRFYITLLSVLALSAIYCAQCRVAFGDSPSNEAASLYVGKGRMLSISTPRLLTKNAGVTEYMCAPNGLEVAFVGQAGWVQSIGAVTLTGGPPRSLFSIDMWSPDDQDDKPPPDANPYGEVSRMFGWSPDSRYVLADVYRFDLEQTELVSVDTGAQTSYSLPLKSYIRTLSWNQDGSRIACDFVTTDTDARTVQYDIYILTPDLKTVAVIEAAVRHFGDKEKNECNDVGWLDSGTVAFRATANGSSTWSKADVASGARSELTSAPPELFTSEDRGPILSMSLGLSGVTLQVTTAGAGGQAASPGGFQVITISSSADLPSGKPNPPAILDSARAPNASFMPTAGYSGGVYHVLYVSWGDLRIADLSTRAGNATEKVQVGYPLSDDEKVEMAISDAKQIGLAILQYTQDNNENLPDQADFHDEVWPYLKAEEPFNPAGGQLALVYDPPSDLSFAHIQDPATTEMGYVAVPGGRVVLFADGHVKMIPAP